MDQTIDCPQANADDPMAESFIIFKTIGGALHALHVSDSLDDAQAKMGEILALADMEPPGAHTGDCMFALPARGFHQFD